MSKQEMTECEKMLKIIRKREMRERYRRTGITRIKKMTKMYLLYVVPLSVLILNSLLHKTGPHCKDSRLKGSVIFLSPL
jgi:hypothetical protein